MVWFSRSLLACQEFRPRIDRKSFRHEHLRKLLSTVRSFEYSESRTMKSFLLLVAAVLGCLSITSTASACDCCPTKVCCAPPPPVEVTWCVVDPCNGCKYEVSACLPACCKCETPCLAGWKPGLLGRKVLSYKFECGECVEVVITKHGRTIVRD